MERREEMARVWKLGVGLETGSGCGDQGNGTGS